MAMTNLFTGTHGRVLEVPTPDGPAFIDPRQIVCVRPVTGGLRIALRGSVVVEAEGVPIEDFLRAWAG